MTLSVDSQTSSEDTFNVKIDGKFHFMQAECWLIKIIVFIKQRIAEKLIVIFALGFEVYLLNHDLEATNMGI